MNLKNISKRKLILFFGDTIIIFFSINLASIVRAKTQFNFLNFQRDLIFFVILFIYILSFYIFDLYNPKSRFLNSQSFIMFIAGLASASLLITIFFYLLPFKFGRGIFLISFILIGILTFTWRIFFSTFIKLAISKRKVLIVGTGKLAKTIYLIIKKNPEYKVIGFIYDKPRDRKSSEINILGDTFSLEKIANDYNIDDIILCVETIRKKGLSKALINCKMKGMNIYDMANFYEQLMDKLPVLQIKEKWLVYCDGFEKLGNRIYRKLKRTMDFLISFFLLVISLPLLIIFSLLIKLTSKGPILLIQDRIGKNMKPFKMLKFRTMFNDAEKEGPIWTKVDDARVTWVGRMLRKTRLDELPQLINVIKGEMSLIGPRPEREFFVKKLTEKIPYYSLRFAVKPGLTGWAQINYRYGSNTDDAIEKLRYELYYIKNQSLFLDLGIILKTIRVMLFGMGR